MKTWKDVRPEIYTAEEIRESDLRVAIGKLELYCQLDEGRKAVKEGRTRPFAEFMQEFEREIAGDA